MVYGICVCPQSKRDELKRMGFNGEWSKRDERGRKGVKKGEDRLQTVDCGGEGEVVEAHSRIGVLGA